MKFQDQIKNDTTQDHDIIDVGVKMALDMGRSDTEAALRTVAMVSLSLCHSRGGLRGPTRLHCVFIAAGLH